MTTEAQIEAHRRNAQLSTGPPHPRGQGPFRPERPQAQYPCPGHPRRPVCSPRRRPPAVRLPLRRPCRRPPARWRHRGHLPRSHRPQPLAPPSSPPRRDGLHSPAPGLPAQRLPPPRAGSPQPTRLRHPRKAHALRIPPQPPAQRRPRPARPPPGPPRCQSQVDARQQDRRHYPLLRTRPIRPPRHPIPPSFTPRGCLRHSGPFHRRTESRPP